MTAARTWLILGATSIIAEEFAHLAAQANNNLILVGRDRPQLEIIAANIRLRYPINCEVFFTDFSADLRNLLDLLQRKSSPELALFIAHSAILQNDELNLMAIEEMIHTNVLSTLQLINTYLKKPQSNHRLIFLSSVAACRGRSKNSLYGGTKAAIEIYLEGLQQSAKRNLRITIARLGFIDTAQTYGAPGIFYASSPKACAKACWRASKAGKRWIYHPFFWRYIMAIITRLPFFIYKRMKF
ncbi:SDR family NAD(P)-dependent oxidoreductase [Legionella cardiaca]|uniref:SDR family NAD(P)-dependent oxidoreductase n=1 Tax=Legionella cardiaca TaxID=1071983 RepID=A0ABY8AVH7_9GAMM|nr:SDR family NAD(P)-dependent oxidoreductase [Legionella cardiaca]WED43741.1 SDR family NAD(P)-dependent oxidoreductase [Legionella cardiaca]